MNSAFQIYTLRHNLKIRWRNSSSVFVIFSSIFCLLSSLHSPSYQVSASSFSNNPSHDMTFRNDIAFSNSHPPFYHGDFNQSFSYSGASPKSTNFKRRVFSKNKSWSNGRFFGMGFNIGSPDIRLNAPELMESKGYTVEKHRIVTRDGYILEAHRIPAPGRPVIAAFHGMLQSSRDFLMNSKHRAFAYKMADNNYDVWLLNARGNVYSRMHQYLNVNSGAYWDYSVDEIALNDVPASIDYILAVTGQPRLNWVGYSLGSAVFFACMSSLPEYNDKINVFVSMGTTAYVGNVKSPVLRLVAPLARIQDTVVTALNHGEFLPQFLFPIMRTLFPLLCQPEASLNKVGLCSSFIFLIAGFNPAQSNPSMMPVMLGGTPSSISVKMLSHWYSWINTGKFIHYDYGHQGNLAKYNSATPPSYDLTKVTAKTVNMWAQNDWLSVPRDVEKTVAELPNVVANIRIDSDTFNHLDFIYGKDADKYVYDRMLQALQAYT